MSVLCSEAFKFILKIIQNFNFSNYCKAHQYIRDFKISGHFVIEEHQNRGSGAQNKDINMVFKIELLHNTKYYKLLLGTTK